MDPFRFSSLIKSLEEAFSLMFPWISMFGFPGIVKFMALVCTLYPDIQFGKKIPDLLHDLYGSHRHISFSAS